jgi:hypothetical protein
MSFFIKFSSSIFICWCQNSSFSFCRSRSAKKKE